EKGLKNLKDTGKSDEKTALAVQLKLVNRIIDTIRSETQVEDFESLAVDGEGRELLALLDTVHAPGSKNTGERPETSLIESALFTGAHGEPGMNLELRKEIPSADRIDLLVSFIKWSGLRLMIDDLRRFTENGGTLRVITTTYMGATDAKAIEELSKLPNTEIMVSYDTRITRLHAKSYVFYRDTGFTTAYVGSSNMSSAALTSGLEWNVKVTAADQPDVLKKIEATFDSYWNAPEFERYDQGQENRLIKALRGESSLVKEGQRQYFYDLRPFSYQQEILDELEAERTIRGHYKNLVVAATGTGKTMITAFDYKRFLKEHPEGPGRLLFIAHRKEILSQSLDAFRSVLKDPDFGDLFVGDSRPERSDHLFMSIQSFRAQDWTSKTSSDYYDYIVVDEFHHAAAEGYQKLLDYYKPEILIGLTATPERMDGKDVTRYFDNRIAAEIRLPEAVERKLLCPFQYFGVSDDTDLTELKWSRGGYDSTELENLYVFSNAAAQKRCRLIINSLDRYLTDLDATKGLGFCVSIRHAQFMAEEFNRAGIPSAALSGNSNTVERQQVQKDLRSGKIKFIFTVDLYNEGIDIPEINTVLFLRPTESLTVFLQQLGRGLRLSEGKDCLTVLDYIGQAGKKYRFAEKYEALLYHPRHGLKKEIESGFTSVPKGCYICLEKKAQKIILENIKAVVNTKAGLTARIRDYAETGQPLRLSAFLEYEHLRPGVLYKRDSFSRLCADAGLIPDFSSPVEEVMRKAFPRICSIDSRRWIRLLQKLLVNIGPEDDAVREYDSLTENEKRMLRMFQITVWQKPARDAGFRNELEALQEITACPELREELLDLLEYNYERIDFIDQPADLPYDCPLDVYCTYSRDQLLTALDFEKPATVREGVKYLKDRKTDVFMITLNKSDKDYSPSTMYEDYSVNESLFHWQSQSTISPDSPTGRRYIEQKQRHNTILLFVREFKKDSDKNAAPYTFLGPAEYVSHTGSKPMSILWKLKNPIPSKLISRTNKLAAV
ncbi:MAG: DUF3427 domain-containing protein, partial [Eubacteriaceae bacterium]